MSFATKAQNIVNKTVVVVHLILFFKKGQQVTRQCSFGSDRNDVTRMWQISDRRAFLPNALDSKTADHLPTTCVTSLTNGPEPRSLGCSFNQMQQH